MAVEVREWRARVCGGREWRHRRPHQRRKSNGVSDRVGGERATLSEIRVRDLRRRRVVTIRGERRNEKFWGHAAEFLQFGGRIEK